MLLSSRSYVRDLSLLQTLSKMGGVSQKTAISRRLAKPRLRSQSTESIIQWVPRRVVPQRSNLVANKLFSGIRRFPITTLASSKWGWVGHWCNNLELEISVWYIQAWISLRPEISGQRQKHSSLPEISRSVLAQNILFKGMSSIYPEEDFIHFLYLGREPEVVERRKQSIAISFRRHGTVVRSSYYRLGYITALGFSQALSKSAIYSVFYNVRWLALIPLIFVSAFLQGHIRIPYTSQALSISSYKPLMFFGLEPLSLTFFPITPPLLPHTATRWNLTPPTLVKTPSHIPLSGVSLSIRSV